MEFYRKFIYKIVLSDRKGFIYSASFDLHYLTGFMDFSIKAPYSPAYTKIINNNNIYLINTELLNSPIPIDEPLAIEYLMNLFFNILKNPLDRLSR
ncbi:hypothetical protein U3516DRAFT_748153 [Neocallimastix sp. 'constans']